MDELRRRFRAMLQDIPLSLAVREAMRLVALQRHLPADVTVLDVGCGDGSFWKAYPGLERLTLDGVDLNRDEVALARRTGIYRHLDVADISQSAPCRDYDFVVGNCSLEHVPNIHGALVHIRHALNPGGRLLLFVPAFGWARSLRSVQLLGRLGTRLEMAASGALDGFFQHHHIYDATSWRLLVEAAGYRVAGEWGLGAPAMNRVFEQQLPMALAEFLHKCFWKRYPGWSFHRRLPGQEFFDALAAQPVPLGAPGVVEYLLEAVPQESSA